MIYGFTPGLLELLQMPVHLIVLVGCGLLLGQQGIPYWRWLVPGFVVSLLAGMAVANGWSLALPINNERVLLVTAIVAGVLVMLAYRLPRWLVIALMLLVAGLLGLDTVPVMLPGISPYKLYWTLAGSASGSFLLLLVVTLLGFLLQTLWEGIAVRVLASWVTASAMLTLALRLVQKS